MISGVQAKRTIVIMSTYPNDNDTGTKNRVMSVQKTPTPDGLPEGNWYRYIIGIGESKIEGVRSGTLNDVIEHAEAVAEHLNTRRGRSSYTFPVSRKKIT